VLALAAIVSAAGRRGAVQTTPDAGWSRVAQWYADHLRQVGIVGSSLVLMRDGTIVRQQVEGFQDLEARRRVDADTIYHWASITKTFTGIAIMQLRDRGLLALDDPVVKYVPELCEVHNPFGDISQVTIRQLMSHSAGFRGATWPWGGDQAWHPFEPTRWEQLVAMLPYTDIRFKPGSKYSYSNPGVIFLGKIIERLSGDDYEMYVTKNILMPLGMHRTFFDRAPYRLLPNRSHSYFRSDDGLKEARFDFDTGITVSNGGLNAPLDDMARYLAFLSGSPSPASIDKTRSAAVSNGASAAGYDIVLKRSSLEEMFVPVLPATEGEGGGSGVSIALSFFVERHQGLEFVAHSGGQNGFISHFYLHRPSRAAYIVAFNTDVTTKGERDLTRELDAQLRDVIIKEMFAGSAR
jgi:CubicO group peptidase (beta-lactamase class C family)